MITPHDEAIVKKWNNEVRHAIRMGLSLTKDEKSIIFQEYCDHLVRIAPQIRIEKDAQEETIVPTIRIGKNIRYQALPQGNELIPFLSVLADSPVSVDRIAASLQGQLDKIKVPAFLKSYITPTCPFCPAAVKQLLAMAQSNEFIQLTIIDASLFPKMAEVDHIQSTPTVLLDDQFRWTGSIQLSELLDMIVNRDPSKLSALSLKGMFDEGNASGVAQMMIDCGEIFPAFIETLAHTQWPVRLAAMVAFETIADKNKALAAQVIPPLWEHFKNAEDQIQGDIVYLLGESGDASVIPKLKLVIEGPYDPEVKEAAVEAIEKLEP
jgi:hypothetical protein